MIFYKIVRAAVRGMSVQQARGHLTTPPLILHVSQV